MNGHEINNGHITIGQVAELVSSKVKIHLSDESVSQIKKCRDYLEGELSEDKGAIYGINTGFGSLHNVRIDGKDLTTLQENLVKSHACGAGPMVSEEIVRQAEDSIISMQVQALKPA